MAEKAISPRVYVLIFAALLLLTGVTTGIAFVPLGAGNDPVALLIAIIKASLVVLFFMHAWHSPRLIRATIAVACLLALILLSLTMSDYLTRDWLSG